MANAWSDGEGPLVDERQFTPWAEPGWKSWNVYSPEQWFCETAGVLAEHVGGVVIETGAGQGYITRRVAGRSDSYLVYESSVPMRKAIPAGEGYLVVDEPTPDEGELEICSLLIVDSAMQFRRQEIALWFEHAPDDSLLLMHDAGNGHDKRNTAYTHKQYWRMVQDLGVPGIRFANPRGAFLGWKQQPSDEDLEYFMSLGPVQG